VLLTAKRQWLDLRRAYNELYFSDKAEIDLQEIKDYIAIDNSKAALNLLSYFEKTFDNLAIMPNMGHLNKDLSKKDVLFWNVKKYIIVYRIKNFDIIILRVLSGYRDIISILE